LPGIAEHVAGSALWETQLMYMNLTASALALPDARKQADERYHRPTMVDTMPRAGPVFLASVYACDHKETLRAVCNVQLGVLTLSATERFHAS